MLSQERAKLCDLHIFEPKLSFSQGVRIGLDRITSSEEILEGQLVFDESPILNYCRGDTEDTEGLLASLHSLSNNEIRRLRDRLSSLYPRTLEEARRCMKIMYQGISSEMLEQVILQAEHWIIAQCIFNGYHSSLSHSSKYLFAEPSKMNHSCNPNCTWSVMSGRLIVKSRRSILPEEEITISYVPKIELLSGRLRRNQLMKLDFFCHCEMCRDRCHTCDVLKSREQLQFCARCKTVPYCSKECQKADWDEHKKLCNRVQS